MTALKLFKRFLIPSSAVVGVQVVDGQARPTGEPICDEQGKRLVRPSDLPIYGDECYICNDKPCDDPCALEAQVGHLRKELWVWVDKYKGYRSKVIDVCAQGKVHFESTLDTLREETNYLPRAGAIGLSGLAGVVFGMRGGIIRKLTYGTVGAGAMAAVCYPREATEYTHVTLHYLKKYVRIGYNFIYGVKPDYIKLPEPATFLPDEGESPRPSSVVARVVGESPPVKTSPTVRAADPKETEKTIKTSRDQSKSEDRDLYSNRST